MLSVFLFKDKTFRTEEGVKNGFFDSLTNFTRDYEESIRLVFSPKILVISIKH